MVSQSPKDVIAWRKNDRIFNPNLKKDSYQSKIDKMLKKKEDYMVKNEEKFKKKKNFII